MDGEQLPKGRLIVNCSRCKRQYDQTDLAEVWMGWKILAFPLLVLKAPLMRESRGSYCHGCRRIVNLCFGVVAFFCVFVFGGGLVSRLFALISAN